MTETTQQSLMEYLGQSTVSVFLLLIMTATPTHAILHHQHQPMQQQHYHRHRQWHESESNAAFFRMRSLFQHTSSKSADATTTRAVADDVGPHPSDLTIVEANVAALVGLKSNNIRCETGGDIYPDFEWFNHTIRGVGCACCYDTTRCTDCHFNCMSPSVLWFCHVDPVTHNVTSCPGLPDVSCEGDCMEGSCGINCAQSTKCKNGTSDRSIDGTCNCIDGSCSSGLCGVNCDIIPRCNTANGRLNNENGLCDECFDKWQGYDVTTCSVTPTCVKGNSLSFDTQSGACICKSLWFGERCDQSLLMWLFIALTATALAIAFGVCLYRWFRRTRTDVSSLNRRLLEVQHEAYLFDEQLRQELMKEEAATRERNEWHGQNAAVSAESFRRIMTGLNLIQAQLQQLTQDQLQRRRQRHQQQPPPGDNSDAATLPLHVQANNVIN